MCYYQEQPKLFWENLSFWFLFWWQLTLLASTSGTHGKDIANFIASSLYRDFISPNKIKGVCGGGGASKNICSSVAVALEKQWLFLPWLHAAHLHIR